MILAGLILAVGANAQSKISNHIAEVNLPKSSKNVTMTDFETYGKRKFKRDLKPFDNGKTFIVDDAMFVSIGELQKSAATKKSLEKWKRQLEALYKEMGQPWDQSEIDTINGTRFYIFEEHRDEEFKSLFYSEDVDDKSVSGFIVYKLKDRDKAHTYLSDLLKNIKLKKQ